MKTEMKKEIFSQKEVIKAICGKYLNSGKIDFGFEVDFCEVKFIASGSSYNAARLAHKFFENHTELRVGFDYASEFISNPNKKINKDTLYCFVSQSGETFDTKCALDIVKKEGGKTLAIVNNSNSTIYNLADFKIDMLAGKENSIAATKSFLAGVICLWLFSLKYSKDEFNFTLALNEATNAVDDVLLMAEQIEQAAKTVYKKNKLSIIGYGYGYILAKEAALKIKETSYIDTTAYPTGEFLHGHTAILNTNKNLIEIFTKDLSTFEENTLKKIKKDFAPDVLAITDSGAEFKSAIKFKDYKAEISKISAITVIIQLLALKIALLNGLDVDKPNGLNKVVTG